MNLTVKTRDSKALRLSCDMHMCANVAAFTVGRGENAEGTVNFCEACFRKIVNDGAELLTRTSDIKKRKGNG